MDTFESWDNKNPETRFCPSIWFFFTKSLITKGWVQKWPNLKFSSWGLKTSSITKPQASLKPLQRPQLNFWPSGGPKVSIMTKLKDDLQTNISFFCTATTWTLFELLNLILAFEIHRRIFDSGKMVLICNIPFCHSSGSLYRKIISPKIFDRKANWPEHHLTEHRLTEKSHLAENKIYQKGKYLKNGHLTENLTWKTSQMTEMTYDRKFFLPKAFSEKWSFDRKVIDRKFIWPNAFFRKMVIWPKKFLTKGKTTLIHH
jgi:hypothetical protein